MATKARDAWALTDAEIDLLRRVENREHFKALCAHLQAVRQMLVDSELDANAVMNVFANAGISVWPQTVQDILAQRYAVAQERRQALSK